jgi:hypothetical protein
VGELHLEDDGSADLVAAPDQRDLATSPEA